MRITNIQHHSRGSNNERKAILKNELMGEGESLYVRDSELEHVIVIFLRIILN